MKQLNTFAFIFFLLYCSTVIGQVVYVDSSATTGANNGTSWSNAYTDLQDALSTSADSVFVSKGTYYPGVGAINRGISFNLKDSIVVLGGFNTTSGDTTLQSRDWNEHLTILDGNVGNTSTAGDNVYNVVEVTQANAYPAIDGFIIRNGNANGPIGSARINGGGISIRNGHISVENCRISDNYANNLGGGIFVSAGSGNFGEKVTITNSIIENNSANISGGGLYISNSDSVILVNVLLRGNISDEGGGLAVAIKSAVVVNSTITGNYANNGGGGISVRLGSGMPILSLYNSIIWNNVVDGNADTTAASIQMVDGSASSDTVFIGNCIVEHSGGSTAWVMPDGFIDRGENLDVDPLFVLDADPFSAPNTLGDLSLQLPSPAFNAGDAQYFDTSFSPFDLDGQDRIRVGQIDMGAYESATGLISVLYVDSAAAPNGNGLTWATAMNELQNALYVPHPVDSIFVSKGTYYPDLGTMSRFASFDIPDSLILLGGFNAQGGDTILSQRNWEFNRTVLNGDIDRDSLGALTNNSYHVLTSSNTCSHTLIDGFYVQNGNANETTGSNSRGGGMHNGQNSYLRISNMVFRNNHAQYGGGIYNNLGLVNINRVRFIENTGMNAGGGMYNDENSSKISNSVFIKNSGNGLYNGYNSPVVVNTSFRGNSTSLNGGGIINIGSDGVFINVLVSGNNGANGGGMLNLDSDATVLNSTFCGNVSTADGSGGAIQNLNCNPTIENTIIWQNMSNGDSTTIVASISNQNNAMPTIKYSLIGNSGGSGIGWETAMGVDSGGNLDANPLFVHPISPSPSDTTGGDYSLSPYSPAINAGDSTLYQAENGPQTDVAINNRIQLNQIDLGAYESAGYCSDSLPNLRAVAVALDTSGQAVLHPKMFVELADPDTVFYFTGSLQEFQVPAGVTSIYIEAAGGKGGDATTTNSGSTGGLGAIVGSEFNVAPGDVLQLIVGGQGRNGPYSAGGGGATFIAEGLYGYVDFQPEKIRLIAAGGGGGASGQKPGEAATRTQLNALGNAGIGLAGGASALYNGPSNQNGKAAVNGAAGGGTHGGYGGGGGRYQGINPYRGGGGGGATGGRSEVFRGGKAGISYIGGLHPFITQSGNEGDGYIKIKYNYGDPPFTIIPTSVYCSDIGLDSVGIVRTNCIGTVDTLFVALNVMDVIPPEIELPADITVQCSDSIAPMYTGYAIGIPVDSCGIDSITYSDKFFDNVCTDSIIRTWIAYDINGNQSERRIQRMVIQDVNSPMLSCSPSQAYYRSDFIHSLATMSDTPSTSFNFQTKTFTLDGFDDMVGTITSIDLSFYISCSSSNVIAGDLISPTGTRINIFNFNTVCNSADIQAEFSDNSLLSEDDLQTNCGGVPGRGPGRYRPISPFSALNGENPAGTWKLVLDAILFEVYTLEHWSLTIHTSPQPSIDDQCSEAMFTYSDDVSGINSCGVGTLERTYYGIDGCGNTDTCQTLFTILPDTAANVLYVDSSATGSGSGVTWSDAYTDLWSLFSDSCATLPDTIKLAGATYASTNMDRAASLLLSDDIVLIGGYSPGGSAYDPSKYKTTLDGNLGADTIVDNNVYHVITIDENASDVQLHDLTITGGYANGQGLDAAGGGLLCLGKVGLNRVRVSGNFSDVLSPGICISSTGDLSISGPSVIENNVSGDGSLFDMMTNGVLYLGKDVLIQE